MQTLYAIIYNDMKQRILTGDLKAGDRIPTEKELSETYSVSRITSKKALDMLNSEGLIDRFPGRGSFVTVPEKKDVAQVVENRPFLDVSKTIGLILEDFAENFGVFILSGVERACGEAGYSLIIKRTFGSQESEKNAIKELREKGVSGLLIMPVHGDSYNEEILKLALDHFPTVLLDRQLKGMPIPYVGTDNINAAKELADFLFLHGHKKICIISPPGDETSSVADRIAGFIRSNEERGIIPEKYIMTAVRGTLPEKSPGECLSSDVEKITQYLSLHPEVTGILAVEYNIALTTLYAIENMGKTAPGDYEIVCFDGPANYISKYEFTHARQDEEGIGREGVRILLEQINGGSPGNSHVEFPAVILERKNYRKRC